MKILTEEELKAAETALTAFLPHSMQVYGYISIVNRVKSVSLDVFVDAWPDFTTILCQPQRKEEGDFFKDLCVFSKDETTLVKIFSENALLNCGEFVCIAADLCHGETLLGVARNMGIPGKRIAVCHLMKLQDPSCLPLVDSLPLRVSTLDESHVDLVNRTWKFGCGERSSGMIRDMIRHYPSCCLMDGEGRAVAWVLTYASCAMGMLYTLPEYRGKGYAKALIRAMATRLHAQGYPVYCFIEEENQLSYELFKNWASLRTPPTGQPVVLAVCRSDWPVLLCLGRGTLQAHPGAWSHNYNPPFTPTPHRNSGHDGFSCTNKTLATASPTLTIDPRVV
ncbi:hypothetical protein AGOR_G00213260 [Albula goreensis]|uniref:Glycine N-acyltransferase-like protein n=1 Tax=Albula goreensis TaxID=1534307 RepID=A0A8T3CSY9_9TELE|nr:hypothetical protein AGOR_G00213260 [Albula goreensis]